MKKPMYGTVCGNGKYDLTEEQLFDLVRENPTFTDPDDVFAEDTNGNTYTGRDVCYMANVEIEVPQQ